MLLLECSHVKKYFGDRLILMIEQLKVYSEDRIGIVGVNGAGKTTLVNLLSQRLEPDEGWVKVNAQFSYVSQLEQPEKQRISSELATKFGVATKWNESLSGGEKTRFKLAECFSRNSLMIFADEPTSNMDLEGIELIENQFAQYQGALVLISHDRSFLDKLCNKIIEVENGKIQIYNGSYSDYSDQKRLEREQAQFEYQQYVNEKKRLEGVIADTKQQVKSVRKAPKRMGNSEARLHKMGDQKAKANLDRSIKNVESRIEHLGVKEKPVKQEKIKLDFAESEKLHSRVILEGKGICKKFREKVLFEDAEFKIENEAKMALIGPNGCGKTTLLKMIMAKDASIKIAPRAKIGYFSQDMCSLNENLTVLENVMKSSIYPEAFVRSLLARLLFKGENVYKPARVLSGGERVKAAFAKILFQDINLLILDEPTNYMDINSLEVMEEALQRYDRTLLFVSHDRRFINSAADHIMTIENHKIRVFDGTYEEYLGSRDKSLDSDSEKIKERIFVLQHRLTQVVGRISMPSQNEDLEALDKEYHELLNELKRLSKS
ncbi:ribosomal protection-like ABC-F family protein [Desulfitobacterium sp. Sab5]|uniref:ribosomal protection-like ABC-F family protein n=1 Tax=Desulfitobacterium nosdiversum TaxID=3375356 RepID=UPI003CEA4EB6